MKTTRKCECGGTMHHSSDMENPDHGEFWQCEDCGEIVDENVVQVDRSGVGHCWRDASDDDTASVRSELNAAMAEQDHCDDYIAQNGVHYRW